jgi:L-glyceraldehyde 3-phosphate reductase
MATSVRQVGRVAGLSLPQIAYRFILDNPGVTTVLGGFSTIAQLDDLASASDMACLAPDIIGRLEDLWRRDFHV